MRSIYSLANIEGDTFSNFFFGHSTVLWDGKKYIW